MVDLSALQSVIEVVSEQRLSEAVAIWENFRAAAVVPYLPVFYHAEALAQEISFGLLVEQNKGALILIDGVHRSLAAQLRGLRQVYVALIVPERTLPPVASPIPLEQVRSSATEVSGSPIFEGKGYADFRPGSLFTATASGIIMRKLGLGAHGRCDAE
jgi:hypothetical protein